MRCAEPVGRSEGFACVRVLWVWATLVAGAALLAGCMPLYVPPIPETVEASEPVTVSGESTLESRDGTLVATIHLAGATERGWLVLQWYAPSLREVASDSVWVERGSIEERVVIAAPDSLHIGEGRWRLVVSFGGVVLRQLETTVGPSG